MGTTCLLGPCLQGVQRQLSCWLRDQVHVFQNYGAANGSLVQFFKQQAEAARKVGGAGARTWESCSRRSGGLTSLGAPSRPDDLARIVARREPCGSPTSGGLPPFPLTHPHPPLTPPAGPGGWWWAGRCAWSGTCGWCGGGAASAGPISKRRHRCACGAGRASFIHACRQGPPPYCLLHLAGPSLECTFECVLGWGRKKHRCAPGSSAHHEPSS